MRRAFLIAPPHNDVTLIIVGHPTSSRPTKPLIFFSTLLSASHNTMSDYAFRKINIDALDEDVLLPSDLYDPDPRGPDGVLEDAKRRSAEVRGLVSR